MADSLPSPPPSHSGTPEPNINPNTASDSSAHTSTLANRLDTLLEKYLELLDTYTTLRADLSKTFSDGFLSLAQAQRASTLGSGRRYGAEYYDQRMKGQRVVRVCEVESSQVEDGEAHGTEEDEDESEDEGVEGRKDMVWNIERRLTAPAATTKERNSFRESKYDDDEKQDRPDQVMQDEKEIKDEHTKSTPQPKVDPADRDPITWFGILAPPALRQTQRHFITVVENQIPELLNVNLQMQRLEDEIWSVRGELGMMGEYDVLEQEQEQEQDKDEQAEAVGDVNEEKEAQKAANSHRTSSSRRKLPGRPAHSKSTLLQLGD